MNQTWNQTALRHPLGLHCAACLTIATKTDARSVPLDIITAAHTATHHQTGQMPGGPTINGDVRHVSPWFPAGRRAPPPPAAPNLLASHIACASTDSLCRAHPSPAIARTFVSAAVRTRAHATGVSARKRYGGQVTITRGGPRGSGSRPHQAGIGRHRVVPLSGIPRRAATHRRHQAQA